MTQIPNFNPDLLTDLAYRKVVLFLGAGVSASAITATGTRIAGWPKFLAKCNANVPEPLKTEIQNLIQEKDYLLSCELLQNHYGDDWGGVVSSEFGQKASPSPLHHALLGLRQRLILTTNFDKLIENAWNTETDGNTHFPTVIDSINDSTFRILKDHDSNFVLKIHGSIDNKDSLVFSRSEYIRKAFGNHNYSDFIHSLLLNYTFIFIGFSMNDPAITSLMEMYTLRYPNARPHYIFAPGIMNDSMVRIYKTLRKLIVISYDPANNHEALPIIINSLAEQSRDRYRLLVSEMMKLVNN